jgi:hypothetical protein
VSGTLPFRAQYYAEVRTLDFLGRHVIESRVRPARTSSRRRDRPAMTVTPESG